MKLTIKAIVALGMILVILITGVIGFSLGINVMTHSHKACLIKEEKLFVKDACDITVQDDRTDGVYINGREFWTYLIIYVVVMVVNSLGAIILGLFQFLKKLNPFFVFITTFFSEHAILMSALYYNA